MDNFGAVRRLAREKRAAVKAKGSVATAVELLAAARAETGVAVRRVAPENPLLSGGEGALRRGGEETAIYISSVLEPEMAAYVEAHEFGHFWIETPDAAAVTPRNPDPGAPEENTPLGLRRVEAYSPQELRERYANVFAREFLLPGSEAAERFMAGAPASQIAADVGVPLGLVDQQLAVSLLLPNIDPEKEPGDLERPGLDDSQKAAAEFEGAPLLVEAGPGTGKTRTLIARIEYLLSKGVPAPSILALTFSNKAAKEIRARVAAVAPAAAAEIWAGTFHAFGLELLRKYGHLDGIKEPVELLDQADQLKFLEGELSQLELDHYLWLSEPAFALRHILGAISRAKDEMFGPQAYADAAERMASDAEGDAKATLRADKAAEVAGVYRHYEERIRAEGLVDFADLINRPVEILRKHPSVRDELRGQYVHILVDEYQDVNRASALLLKELAGDGDRLWVVGDARQSIYRFRGASPSSTVNFKKDYSKRELKQLAVNYRSREEIVKTFIAYADEMTVGRGRDNVLEAKQGPGAEAVDFNVATVRDAEIAGLASAVRHHVSKGRSFKDQAILCRGHSYLQKIAAGLEAAGIPVLNLGDIFEREEVRDLLSLLSFASEPHRAGLMRIATLPRYRMALADVQMFMKAAHEAGKRPLAALVAAEGMDAVSPEGKKALSLLRSDLAAVEFKTGPGRMLFDLLFERGLVRDYLGGEAAPDQQRRLALHQFLQFAAENDRPGDGDPKRRFLDWIVRLATFGDDRSLRELPAAVEGIDAVRLMTVHMSKGLEFPVVYLPGLGNGMFPSTSGGGSVCPPPDGMLDVPVAVSKAEEEECLFFVALSRARDHLSLSRAQRYDERGVSKPSPALKTIADHLPRQPESAATWAGAVPPRTPDRPRPDLKVTATEHNGYDIETYDGCPRRYLYQVVLGLNRSRQDNGFVHFHRTVYCVLRWLSQQTGEVDAAQIKAKFDARWAETGPVGDPHESILRASAEGMIDRESRRPRGGVLIAQAVSLTVDGHLVRLEIDEIERSGGGVTVRRLRTGRPPSRPDQRLLHALMLRAGELTMKASGSFRIRYLSTDDDLPVKLDGVMDSRMADAAAALAGISEGRYPPNPNDDCPRCPYYFICQAVPD